MKINKDKLEGIHYIVEYAIASGRLEVINEIFSGEQIKELSRDEKEGTIFSTVYYDCKVPEVKDNALKIMSYLIFDYKINEENSIKSIYDFENETIENMFQTRKIKDELNFELNNNHKVNKKTKI